MTLASSTVTLARVNDGAAGRTYFAEFSANVLRRGASGAVTPAVLTASAYYRDGDSAARTAYAGRWVVATSTDGIKFTDAAASGDVPSYSFSVASLAASVVAVRFTLYAAGGTTLQLDMQTVPVVVDVDALTHEQIFNLLTDNGRAQGIFIEGGQLYINGAYIKSRSISADKLLIGNFYNLAVIDPEYNNEYNSELSDIGGKKYFRFGGEDANYYSLILHRFPPNTVFNAGDRYLLRANGFRTNEVIVNVTIRVVYDDYSYENLGSTSAVIPCSSDTAGEFSSIIEISRVPTFSKPVREYRLFCEQGANVAAYVYMRDISVHRMDTGELIVNGAVTAGKLAAGAVTTDKLAANSVTAEKLAAGSITADKVASNSITADKLHIGNFYNLAVIDPEYANEYGAAVEAISGKKYFRFGGTAANYYSLILHRFPENSVFDVGDRYLIRANGFRTSDVNVSLIFRLYYTDYTFENLGTAAVSVPRTSGTAGEISAIVEIKQTPKLTKTVLHYRLFCETSNNAAGYVYMRDISVHRMDTAELIVDGAVTADKLDAGAVTADKLAAGAVTADKLEANAVTADKLAAKSVTAGKLSISSLSAISANLGTVTAGTIQSANYRSGSDGMKLTLSDGSWDSPHFKLTASGAMTVTSGKIGDWEITSDRLCYVGDTRIVSLQGSATSGQVLYVGTRKSTAESWAYPFKLNGNGTVECTGLDAQGFLIGGSWGTDCYTTVINNLGLCITSQAQSYQGGQYKGWILKMNTAGALVAVPAIYESGGNWITQDSRTKVIATPWETQSGGGSNAGSGGSGRLPTQVTFS